MFILFQSGINFSRGKSVMCGKVGHTTGACDFSGKKRILVLMTLEDLEFINYFLNKFVGTTYS